MKIGRNEFSELIEGRGDKSEKKYFCCVACALDGIYFFYVM